MHLHRVPDRREVQSWNGPGILPRPREEETVSDKKKYVRPGGLKGLWHGFKETIYGMSAHDMSRAALRTRASMEHLFILITMGDLLGIPILPPYYSLRLLPHVVPQIATWKRRMLREKDISDAMF